MISSNSCRRAPIARGLATLALSVAAYMAGAIPSLAADIGKGAQVARQWCASCHVTDDAPARTVQQGPPTFRAISRSGLTADQLRAFLSHPHGSMPDLSLTRAEMDDLIAYIATLR